MKGGLFFVKVINIRFNDNELKRLDYLCELTKLNRSKSIKIAIEKLISIEGDKKMENIKRIAFNEGVATRKKLLENKQDDYIKKYIRNYIYCNKNDKDKIYSEILQLAVMADVDYNFFDEILYLDSNNLISNDEIFNIVLSFNLGLNSTKFR